MNKKKNKITNNEDFISVLAFGLIGLVIFLKGNDCIIEYLEEDK